MDNLPVSLLSTFTVALLHMLIPSHWLCFVLVGRAQGWRPRKTMFVAASAGLLHVASTMVLGVIIGALGHRFIADGEALEHLGAFVLIGLGLLYLVSHILHAGHHHKHDQSVSQKAAVAALLVSLMLSPCSAVIALVVAMASDRPEWIALIGGLLLLTTVGGMMVLVGLTSLGIEKLQFQFFDRYEKLIVGFVLCVLGAMALLVF